MRQRQRERDLWSDVETYASEADAARYIIADMLKGSVKGGTL